MAEAVVPKIPESRYVYEVLVDGLVKYVGKGTGRRFKNHISTAKRYERYMREGRDVTVSPFYESLLIAIGRGGDISYRIVAEFSTDVDALRKEIEHIASFPIGALWNDSPGGGGGSSRAAFKRWADDAERAAHRRRLSDAWADPELRVRHSEKCKHRLVGAHQSNAAAARWGKPGAREKMSIQAKKIRAFHTAKKNANLYSGALSFGS